MLPNPYNPQLLNRYSYCLNNPIKYNDPSGNVAQLAIAAAVILKGGSAAIDYGWTGNDIKNDLAVINDPNSAVVDRRIAAADMTLALVFEAAEPDELLLINLPLDDLARMGAMPFIKKSILKNTDEFLDICKSSEGLGKGIKILDVADVKEVKSARRLLEYNGNEISINTGHGYLREHNSGISPMNIGTINQIESEIVYDIDAAVKSGINIPTTGKAIERTVNVNGNQIGYSLFQLKDGSYSVSTYYTK
jgi:hypothetical protein